MAKGSLGVDTQVVLLPLETYYWSEGSSGAPVHLRVGGRRSRSDRLKVAVLDTWLDIVTVAVESTGGTGQIPRPAGGATIDGLRMDHSDCQGIVFVRRHVQGNIDSASRM